MSDINPYDLFKFIQKDVTNEALFEATDEAYKDVDEGKLYKNLNNIDDPEEVIQSLAEKGKKKDAHPDGADNPAIKTDGAGVTEVPEETKIQKEMNKQTPDVDSKSDFQKSAGVKKVKDQAKARGVKVGGIKTEEGKLPKNLNNIDKADDYIQDLAEYENSNQNNGEIIADGISEEAVARDLAQKNDGIAMQNPDTQLWSVKSKAHESSSGSAGVVPGSAARESVEDVKEDEVEDEKNDEEVDEAKVDEERTTGDLAGQPDEAETSKAQSIVTKSAARGKKTDNPSADSQSTKCEDQDGAGKKNAQKMVSQSAARTKATDKQTADANAPINTTEMPKQTATKVPYVKEDLSSDGKANGQSIVTKSAARTKAIDNPSADANASINTTEMPKPTPTTVPCVKADDPRMKGKTVDAQMTKEGVITAQGKKVVTKSAARGKKTDGAGKEAPMVDGCKKVKEEVEQTDEAVDVSVSTDDGDINITSDGTSTMVTTSKPDVGLPMDALEVDPMIGEPVDVEGPELDPMEDTELFLDDTEQLEFSDDETLEMAEKLLVAEHLEAMDEGCGKMSAKQKKFVDDMKAKKFSKKNKKKVDDKKKEIK